MLIVGVAICKKDGRHGSKIFLRYAMCSLTNRNVCFLLLMMANFLVMSVGYAAASRSRQNWNIQKSDREIPFWVDGYSKFFRDIGRLLLCQLGEIRNLRMELHTLTGFGMILMFPNGILSLHSPTRQIIFLLPLSETCQDTLRGKTREFMENIRHRYPDTDFYMFAGDFVERPMVLLGGSLPKYRFDCSLQTCNGFSRQS